MVWPVAPTIGQVHSEIPGRPLQWDGRSWQRHRKRKPLGPVLLIGDSLTAFNMSGDTGFKFSQSVEAGFRARLATWTIDAVGGRSMTEATPIITALGTVPADVILELGTNDDAGNTSIGAETAAFTSALDTNIGFLRARGALRIHLVTAWVTPAVSFATMLPGKNAVMIARADTEPDVFVHDIAPFLQANQAGFFFDGVHHLTPLSHRYGAFLANIP
jgi:hypothetical protein